MQYHVKPLVGFYHSRQLPKLSGCEKLILTLGTVPPDKSLKFRELGVPGLRLAEWAVPSGHCAAFRNPLLSRSEDASIVNGAAYLRRRHVRPILLLFHRLTLASVTTSGTRMMLI